MKKILTLALVGITFTLVLAACGSTKKGSCDAYGSVNSTANTDIAQK